MSNANYKKANALRIEAGSCFFISWKKHDHSESLPAVYAEYLLLLRLIILIHLTRRTPRPIKRRPVGLVTKLSNGNIESATSYTMTRRVIERKEQALKFLLGMKSRPFFKLVKSRIILIKYKINYI